MGACLGVVAVPGIVLPLAAPWSATAPAAAPLPLLLTQDNEGHHSLLQGSFLCGGVVLLSRGCPQGCHHTVPGIPDNVSELGQLPEPDGHQVHEVPWEAVKENGLEEFSSLLSRWHDGRRHHLHELCRPPVAKLRPPAGCWCTMVKHTGSKKLHQPVLQLPERVRHGEARLKTPLALSNTWWGMWMSTVLYITCRSLTRLSSMRASASQKQAAAPFSQKSGSFTL